MSKTYVFLQNIETPNASLNKRDCWMPRGDVSYYDPVAQRTFHSRKEKRAWLTQHGLREAGETLNPSRRIKGREKVRRTPQQEAQRVAVRQYVQSHGGVAGLLDRIQRGDGRFV